ncbi:hypothetical protein I8H89_02675 [Candidatus Saccharibacteria bacterium]|nr:hypothetical protein [Candidatus Saccharibacteria bacterium]
MSDTQQRLISTGSVEKVLKQLAYISPNASVDSLIPVDVSIQVPLEQLEDTTVSALLDLHGAIVKVTQIDRRGNPSLFSVYKGKTSAPLASLKAARPAGYPCKLEFSSAAVRQGVVTLEERTEPATS